MSQYNSIPITQLPVGATVLATDIYPAVDTTDIGATHPSGKTKKYTIEQLENYMILNISGSAVNSVRAASTGNYVATYDNGDDGEGATLTNNSTLAAFAADGVTLAVGDRVLIKNQSTLLQNGIYEVTVAGSASVAWVLTRTFDYNGVTRLIEFGDFVGVIEGTINALTFWFQTEPNPIEVGVSDIVFDEENSGAIMTISNIGTGDGIYAGNVGNDAQLKSLVAGPGITLTPSADEIEITSPSGGIAWTVVAGTSQLAVDGNGYTIGNAAQTTITLPAAPTTGATVEIIGAGAGGWVLQANAGQYIRLGNTVTSLGGSVTSQDQYDVISVVWSGVNNTWAVVFGVSLQFTFA